MIGEQRTFTNGRIIVTGGRVRRGKQKRADYLLYYWRAYPLAIVEAAPPHTRGSTRRRIDGLVMGLGSPAHAGIDRPRTSRKS